MKSVRSHVFETNSSSCHSLGIVQQKENYQYYTLTDSGYIKVNADTFYSESDYSIYDTLETKLTLIFAMIASDIYDKRYMEQREKGVRTPISVTREDMMKNQYIKEIDEMLRTEIPNCKGFRFARNSFATKTTPYTVKGSYLGHADGHHFGDARGFGEYLKNNHITLHNLVMNPSIVVKMNMYV